MRIDTCGHQAVMVTLLALWCCPGTVLNAQAIDRGEQISLSMTPTELTTARQVYGITSSQFLRQIESQLTGNGIVVAASSDATRLIIDIKSYDSGPYLGFSKTARIEVGYRLVRPGTAEAVAWTDRCTAKANVDVQDAPDRNRTAVALCVTALGARLAERLVGPAEAVIVR